MFKFKKSMEVITEEDNIDYSNCGPMECAASDATSGCACGSTNNVSSGCRSVSNSCCGAANKSKCSTSDGQPENSAK